MTGSINQVATDVPIKGGQSVTVNAMQPWPSAYRGSKYSLVSDSDFDDAVLKWEHRDLSIFADPPTGLRRAMVVAGKEGGLGSFLVTADREVLTKVPAETYTHIEQAPVDEGWIPVYLGNLEGAIEFGDVDLNPSVGRGINVWSGLPFNHGERWSVASDGTLVWNWKDYRFESAFDHSELIENYQQYRPNPGRLYITEHGHIWVNIPNNDVQPGREAEVAEAVTQWREQAEADGDVATLRLVNRRMVATSTSDDPSDGHIPIHLGHSSQFDQGTLPRPVIDDESYYVTVGQYEQVW